MPIARKLHNFLELTNSEPDGIENVTHNTLAKLNNVDNVFLI
jgi:hypothetical protein